MITTSGRVIAVLMVLLLGSGWLMDYPELVALGLGCLLALGCAGGWLLIRPELVAERGIWPLRVTEGESARSVVTVTNRSRRRSPPVIAIEHIGDRQVVVPLPNLCSGEVHRASYLLPTSRRGVHDIGPLTIGHSDPLQLMYSARKSAEPEKLMVHPRVHRVAPLPAGQARDSDGPTSSNAPLGGVAFHSIREYVPGDPPQLIHWRSTARLNSMMVRHNVTPNEPRLLIVLDCSEKPYDEDSFEHAVRVAGSLCAAACDAGFPLTFRTTGSIRCAVKRGRAGRGQVLDLLAGVQRSSADPGLQGLTGFAPAEGVSLGLITGRAQDGQRAVLANCRSRFQRVNLVRVGDKVERPATSVDGVFTVAVPTISEFAAVWNSRVNR